MDVDMAIMCDDRVLCYLTSSRDTAQHMVDALNNSYPRSVPAPSDDAVSQ
jgi:hypothetical protein